MLRRAGSKNRWCREVGDRGEGLMALVAFQGQSSVVAMIRGSHNEQMQGQHGTQEGPSPCWRGSRAPSRWKQGKPSSEQAVSGRAPDER